MKQLLISTIAMFAFTLALAAEPAKTVSQATDTKPAAKPEMKLAKKKEEKKSNSTKSSPDKKEKSTVK